jgi:phosphoglycerol transferase MdoB-like AlkP superfamily enzyme
LIRDTTFDHLRRGLDRSGPIGVLLASFLVCLAWLTLSRAVLFALYQSRFVGVENIWWLFPIGLRMDVIVLCQIFAIPATLYLLLPGKLIRETIVAVWLTVFAAFLVHMELSTPSFIDEYDNRPDRIYYEYLQYPREVLPTLLKTYPVQLFVVMFLVVAASIAFWRFLRVRMQRSNDWSWSRRALAYPLVAAMLFLGARSTLGHRPANMSTAAFSNHHLVNELAVSSAYSLFSAIYMSAKEVSASKMYGDMPWNEVVSRVRAATLRPQSAFDQPELPSMHRQYPGTRRNHPMNIVVIVLESVGAGFVGSLGGLPLTPNLDRLSGERLSFANLYATGTRTVRGLEAIATGFPPTAAPSVLKLPASQRNFFTLAELLARQGYATDFIYGGASNFDNMGKFFRENGFQRFIEQEDFSAPVFLGTWGVSDEDLMLKAHQTFLQHGERPFFSLILTTSNHVPFEFPPDSIEVNRQPIATRENAVRYTDYAIGKLFELARAAPYFDRTLFLIVADHDARVFGADRVPVEHFRIPGVIVGPGVPKRHETRIVSQIDLAPTLLSLAGIESTHPMLGRDITALSADEPGRAIMQYGNANGFMVGDRIAIHQPGLAAQTFRSFNGRLEPIQHDVELERTALAHLLWADRTYRERLYRLPIQSPTALSQAASPTQYRHKTPAEGVSRSQ